MRVTDLAEVNISNRWILDHECGGDMYANVMRNLLSKTNPKCQSIVISTHVVTLQVHFTVKPKMGFHDSSIKKGAVSHFRASLHVILYSRF